MHAVAKGKSYCVQHDAKVEPPSVDILDVGAPCWDLANLNNVSPKDFDDPEGVITLSNMGLGTLVRTLYK